MLTALDMITRKKLVELFDLMNLKDIEGGEID